MDKRKYYERQDVVGGYFQLRYGGAGGAYVNARECLTALELLPQSGRILDIPCGIGRIAEFTKGSSRSFVGADFSRPMLTEASSRYGAPLTQANSFSLPFPGGVLDGVLSMRFVFHFPELDPFFAEVARVLRRGGMFVFDTYTWSPVMIPGIPVRFGGTSFIHSREAIEKAAARTGFRVSRREGAFLFTPLLYRYLGKTLCGALDRLERRVPVPVRNVSFWQLERTS